MIWLPPARTAVCTEIVWGVPKIGTEDDLSDCAETLVPNLPAFDGFCRAIVVGALDCRGCCSVTWLDTAGDLIMALGDTVAPPGLAIS